MTKWNLSSPRPVGSVRSARRSGSGLVGVCSPSCAGRRPDPDSGACLEVTAVAAGGDAVAVSTLRPRRTTVQAASWSPVYGL
ncbi:hypothetical protein ACFSVJ_29170 [Prauserella oleivorans]